MDRQGNQPNAEQVFLDELDKLGNEFLIDIITSMVNPQSSAPESLKRDFEKTKALLNAFHTKALANLSSRNPFIDQTLKKKAKKAEKSALESAQGNQKAESGSLGQSDSEEGSDSNQSGTGKKNRKSYLPDERYQRGLEKLAAELKITKEELEREVARRKRGKAKKKAGVFLHENKQHPTKKAGDACDCGGSLCKISEKRMHKTLVRAKHVYFTRVQHLEVLKCNTCSERFIPSPEVPAGEEFGLSPEVRTDFAIATANGIPETRQATLLRDQGIHVPRQDINESNQSFGEALAPVVEAMIQEAANSHSISADGTSFKVREVSKIETPPDHKPGKKMNPEDRASTQATVVIGCNADLSLNACIFFIDQMHPGEHLKEILDVRTVEQQPIIMGDMQGNVIDTEAYKEAIQKHKPTPYNRAGCLDHVLVKFENLLNNFPIAKQFLSNLSEVYLYDKIFQQRKLTPEERQVHHLNLSLPLMLEMQQLAQNLLDGKEGHQKVEPNSALGKELKYFLKHFKQFILFCYLVGCPLSNGIAERSFKRIILARKLSMCYQVLKSAKAHANLFSVYATARELGLNVRAYFYDLMTHEAEVRRHPQEWTPQAYLKRLIAEGAPPGKFTDLYRKPLAKSQPA